ncbi:unnamed protein product, partial [Ceratitis capitata]
MLASFSKGYSTVVMHLCTQSSANLQQNNTACCISATVHGGGEGGANAGTPTDRRRVSCAHAPPLSAQR